ncbi:ras-related protein Rab-22A-like protein [Camelus ferus]|nr:ras-related protein Rab-22A-like protein [Camelus ferus]
MVGPSGCQLWMLKAAAICLRKGLDQKWDPGHCSTTQIGVWGRPPKSDGLGRRERNQTLACYLIIPLGPQSDFPVEFRALAPMYYRGSAAAIIVYDITKEETFSTLKNWVKELRQHGPPNIVVAIAGNKCDLIDVREVMERDAKDYADSIHAIFVETSAKNAININELFIEISRRIPSTDANPPSGGKGFKLRRQPSEPKRSCC